MLMIEVYPMRRTSAGDATMCEGRHQEPDFWDVLVRDPDDAENPDPIEEVEDLESEEAVNEAVARMEEKYPDAEVDYIEP